MEDMWVLNKSFSRDFRDNLSNKTVFFIVQWNEHRVEETGRISTVI